MPSHDDDLAWLYGQAPNRPPAEPTHVISPPAHLPAPDRIDPAPPPPGLVPPPPPPGSRAAAARERGPRRRRPVRTALAVLGVLLLVMVAGLVGIPIYAWSQVQRVNATPDGDRPGNQPGSTFLLVGSDSREGLSKAERQRLGTGDTAGQRTDTIMIVSIPPGGKPALISVPRDSYVPIPGNGSNKINAAFAFGGPKLLVETVERNTGLEIDAYAEIGFGGFVNVIDALGGIEMCLPKAIKDRDSHLNLPKGCQNLGGTDALGYVRMRKADARGDLGRVERQREMLAAVAKDAASPATVVNPVRYFNLCTATARSVTLGEDTSFFQTLRLALAMRTVAAGDGLTLTVPVGNADAFTPAGSAVLWDSEKAKKMFADLARGDTSRLQEYATR